MRIMKPSLRWQLLLAAIGLALALSLLSFQVQQAGLCTTPAPAAGGVYVEGIVGAPRAINPLLSDAYPVDRELVDLIFDGLMRVDANGRLVPALAESWAVGEDGRSVRFQLRNNLTWQDGEPVTAADVAFTFNLMADESFPGPPAQKQLWQAVTITVIDPQTIEFTLAVPYAPFLQETTRAILPAHLLAEVSPADLPQHPFNQFPVGTGPFMVDDSQDWTQTGQLHLLPNPLYWRQGTQLEALAFRFFPDEESLLQAFVSGDIQAINQVTASMLPELAALPQVRFFTAGEPRLTTLIFNTDPADEAVTASLAVRRALAHGLDRRQLLDAVLNGQGLLLDGPYLPSSWAYNPDLLTTYPADLAAAAALLEEDGWLLPPAQTIREKESAPLALRFVMMAEQRPLAAAIAEQWNGLGVDTNIRTIASLAELRALLAAGDFDVALVDVLPPADPDLYDFWSQEAIIRGQNYGGWNSRRASEALEAARQLWNVDQRRPFYDSFLRLFSADLPALTLYQHVYTYAVHEDVNQLDIGLIHRPRDRYSTFSTWFMHFREIAVSCPPEEAGG